ncbi:MAG: hypothetical protein H7833_12140 [Magnetococcus sp. DMHC-1]|nr:hypothetical protein [Magnetococcales bacterium]
MKNWDGGPGGRAVPFLQKNLKYKPNFYFPHLRIFSVSPHMGQQKWASLIYSRMNAQKSESLVYLSQGLGTDAESQVPAATGEKREERNAFRPVWINCGKSAKKTPMRQFALRRKYPVTILFTGSEGGT